MAAPRGVKTKRRDRGKVSEWVFFFFFYIYREGAWNKKREKRVLDESFGQQGEMQES